ncbi:hypothetical protein Vafri_11439 [Volvox africanus]|nr:hypothetical protein Vafri_11439 [Volvox africanus]
MHRIYCIREDMEGINWINSVFAAPPLWELDAFGRMFMQLPSSVIDIYSAAGPADGTGHAGCDTHQRGPFESSLQAQPTTAVARNEPWISGLDDGGVLHRIRIAVQSPVAVCAHLPGTTPPPDRNGRLDGPVLHQHDDDMHNGICIGGTSGTTAIGAPAPVPWFQRVAPAMQQKEVQPRLSCPKGEDPCRPSLGVLQGNETIPQWDEGQLDQPLALRYRVKSIPADLAQGGRVVGQQGGVRGRDSGSMWGDGKRSPPGSEAGDDPRQPCSLRTTVAEADGLDLTIMQHLMLKRKRTLDAKQQQQDQQQQEKQLQRQRALGHFGTHFPTLQAPLNQQQPPPQQQLAPWGMPSRIPDGVRSAAQVPSVPAICHQQGRVLASTTPSMIPTTTPEQSAGLLTHPKHRRSSAAAMKLLGSDDSGVGECGDKRWPWLAEKRRDEANRPPGCSQKHDTVLSSILAD